MPLAILTLVGADLPEDRAAIHITSVHVEVQDILLAAEPESSAGRRYRSLWREIADEQGSDLSDRSIRRLGFPVTFTVDTVTGSLTYESATNHDADGDSDGTSIAVPKP